jgi:hypothetical protein
MTDHSTTSPGPEAAVPASHGVPEDRVPLILAIDHRGRLQHERAKR